MIPKKSERWNKEADLKMIASLVMSQNRIPPGTSSQNILIPTDSKDALMLTFKA